MCLLCLFPGCRNCRLIMPDQAVLCGPDSDKPFTERVRFVGDQVALVLAEGEAITAMHDALGIRFDDFPLVPERVYQGIQKEGQYER